MGMGSIKKSPVETEDGFATYRHAAEVVHKKVKNRPALTGRF